MSDTSVNGGPQPQDGAPLLNGLAQYTRDLSFENPNAPRSLTPQEKAPQISIQVNVGAQQLSETDFEVELKLEGNAKIDNDTLFAFDLTYCGIFRAQNIPAEDLHPVIMIECPRLLFPFARQIVADAVRGGGFPPLYVDPIDFAALYRERAQQFAEPPAQAQ
ncbi:protein-export protein SecB [Camelimonas fluminis]|uniref:Protein-export protein SecB n=1 Tax=Camelimonas fluminis TaxID=1576911 RepID=A0ABV7ULE9_9HYPH|nr:protein-export chaperone SecB [Camelimonas fluminis]GHE54651.1 protein-export protein SecB [Camelimonas fluminis]